MSLTFFAHANHPKPWLIGMATALAAAETLDCRLRWPNDLALDGKKLGGVLTELVSTPSGLVPVVGLGINLGPLEFPDFLQGTATSLVRRESLETAKAIVDRVRLMPDPESWLSIAPSWAVRDDTPGKVYVSPQGETVVATGIGEDGSLLAVTEGGVRSFLVADALFGRTAQSAP